MENKGAEAAAVAPMGTEELARLKATAETEAPVTVLQKEPAQQAASPTFMESAKERFTPAVERYWAGLKGKARAAGEYATLRTRQGVSLFGEPNIGAIKTIVDRC